MNGCVWNVKYCPTWLDVIRWKLEAAIQLSVFYTSLNLNMAFWSRRFSSMWFIHGQLLDHMVWNSSWQIINSLVIPFFLITNLIFGVFLGRHMAQDALTPFVCVQSLTTQHFTYEVWYCYAKGLEDNLKSGNTVSFRFS